MTMNDRKTRYERVTQLVEEGYTLQQIGTLLEVTRERARQLVNNLGLHDKRLLIKRQKREESRPFKPIFNCFVINRIFNRCNIDRCGRCGNWFHVSEMIGGKIPENRQQGTCLECAKKYQRELRLKRNQAGLCFRCGVRPVDGIGKSSSGGQCIVCREEFKQNRKDRYYRLYNDGLCVQCAEPVDSDLTMCIACRDRQNKKNREKRNGLRTNSGMGTVGEKAEVALQDKQFEDSLWIGVGGTGLQGK